eukprot:gene4733-9401_t
MTKISTSLTSEQVVKILKGDIALLSPVSIPHGKVFLYLSTTSTDTIKEQNIIFKDVLPKLQERAHKNHAHINICMTPYINNQIQIKNLWINVEQVLKTYHKESKGTFFISLSNDKYGYISLPLHINISKTNQQYSTSPPNITDFSTNIPTDISSTKLFSDWYNSDTNAIPPQFVLQILSTITSTSNKASNRVNEHNKNPSVPHSLLEGLTYKNNTISGSSGSLTDWESRFATQLDPLRCVWIHRPLCGGIGGDKDICDSQEVFIHDVIIEKLHFEETAMQLDISTELLEEMLFHTKYVENECIEGSGKTALLCNLSRRLYDANQSRPVVMRVCGLTRDGSDLLLLIRSIISQIQLTIRDSTATSNISTNSNTATSPTITAVATATATAVQLPVQVPETEIDIDIYNNNNDNSNNNVISSSTSDNKSYSDAVRLLQQLLHEHAIALLLDGIDNVNDRNNHNDINSSNHRNSLSSSNSFISSNSIRSPLDFLRGLIPHRDTRIIVSFNITVTRLTYGQETESGGGEGCDIRRIMESYLSKENNRQLTELQWEYLLTQCTTTHTQTQSQTQTPIHPQTQSQTQSTPPIKLQSPLRRESQIETAAAGTTPLYLTLAKCIVCQWTSSHGLNSTNNMGTNNLGSDSLGSNDLDSSNRGSKNLGSDPLGSKYRGSSLGSTLGLGLYLEPSVDGVITQIVDGIEETFGRQFSRRCLGFLTFSIAGVSDNEMCDLLMLSNIINYNNNKDDNDNSNSYNNNKNSSNNTTSTSTTASSPNNSNSLEYTSWSSCKWPLLAAALAELIIEGTYAHTHPTVTPQPRVHTDTPIWFPSSRINERRCTEALTHLIRANLLEAAAKELCDLTTVCNNILLGNGFTLLDNAYQLFRKMKSLPILNKISIRMKDRVEHYYRWLRRDLKLLIDNPRSMISLTASCQPIISHVREDCYALIQHLRNEQMSRGGGGGGGGNNNDDEYIDDNNDYDDEFMSSFLSGDIDSSWLCGRTLGGSDSFAAQLITLEGHTGGVFAVTFSVDGHLIASGSEDKSVCVWDRDKSICVAKLECIRGNGSTSSGGGSGGTICCVEFNKKGTLLAAAYQDGCVRIWNTLTKICEHVLEGNGAGIANSVTFLHEYDSRVVVGYSDMTITIWDILSGLCISTLTLVDEECVGMAWPVCSSDGKQAAIITSESVVKVWDISPSSHPTVIITITAHSEWVTAVAFSPDGYKLVTGSWDRTAMLWDLRDGSCIGILEGHTSSVCTVCFHPVHGRTVATGSWDRTVRIWDVLKVCCIAIIDGSMDWVLVVRYSSDGSQLVSGCWDGSIQVSEIPEYTSSSSSSSLLIESNDHNDVISSACISCDGGTIISGSKDRSIKIWDAYDGICLGTLMGHAANVTAVGIRVNGTQIVSGSDDKTIKVWDTEKCTCVANLEGHTAEVTAVGFSPGGTRIVSGSLDQTIIIWDVPSQSYLSTLTGHTAAVSSVSFSTAGQTVVSGSHDHTVKIWNVRQSICTATLTAHDDAVLAVAFDRDGDNIVSASVDKTVKIQSIDGAYVLTMTGHESSVTSAIFSADSMMIISGSLDKTVRVWDAAAGTCVLVMRGHRGGVTAVGMNIDCDKIVSASYDKTVKVWELLQENKNKPIATATTATMRRRNSKKNMNSFSYDNYDNNQDLLVEGVVSVAEGEIDLKEGDSMTLSQMKVLVSSGNIRKINDILLLQVREKVEEEIEIEIEISKDNDKDTLSKTTKPIAAGRVGSGVRSTHNVSPLLSMVDE